MKKIQWRKLVVCLAAPLAAGALSALLTRGNMDLFAEIRKPPLSPPSWLFPVVWTVLYIMMGLACYLIATGPKLHYEDRGLKREALILYGAQLFFNFCWPLAFFNLQAYFAAFIWLAALWLLILATILAFKRLSVKAAALLVPYLLWTAFAGYLNWGIYVLN